MILCLDTSSNERLTVALASADGRVRWHKTVPVYFQQSEKLLAVLDSFLRAKRVRLARLSGVAVVSGPGGFTSLRIGVITANTLAYALRIPVLGLRLIDGRGGMETLAKKAAVKLRQERLGTFVTPFYGGPPHITTAKEP